MVSEIHEEIFKITVIYNDIKQGKCKSNGKRTARIYLTVRVLLRNDIETFNEKF